MKIVNVKHSRCDIYGGRPGPLGNPYAVGSYTEIDGKYVLVRTRDEAIDLYDGYFSKRVASDSDFRRLVLNCREKTIGCHCRPNRCHLDVIAAWLRVNAKKYCSFCLERKDECPCPPFG